MVNITDRGLVADSPDAGDFLLVNSFLGTFLCDFPMTKVEGVGFSPFSPHPGYALGENSSSSTHTKQRA